MLHARRGLLPDGLVRTEMAEGASIDAKIFADENPVVKALQLSNYKQLMQPLPQRRPEHDVRPLVKRNFDIEDDGQPGRDANDAATADGAVAAPVPAAATGGTAAGGIGDAAGTGSVAAPTSTEVPSAAADGGPEPGATQSTSVSAERRKRRLRRRERYSIAAPERAAASQASSMSERVFSVLSRANQWCCRARAGAVVAPSSTHRAATATADSVAFGCGRGPVRPGECTPRRRRRGRRSRGTCARSGLDNVARRRDGLPRGPGHPQVSLKRAK